MKQGVFIYICIYIIMVVFSIQVDIKFGLSSLKIAHHTDLIKRESCIQLLLVCMLTG